MCIIASGTTPTWHSSRAPHPCSRATATTSAAPAILLSQVPTAAFRLRLSFRAGSPLLNPGRDRMEGNSPRPHTSSLLLFALIVINFPSNQPSKRCNPKSKRRFRDWGPEPFPASGVHPQRYNHVAAHFLRSNHESDRNRSLRTLLLDFSLAVQQVEEAGQRKPLEDLACPPAALTAS